MSKTALLSLIFFVACSKKPGGEMSVPSASIIYESRGEISIVHSGDKSYFLKRNRANNNIGESFLLSVENTEGVESNSKMEFYYAYEFENDIYFVNGFDTIRPALFHLEQGLNGLKKLNMNIAFDNGINQDSIMINDKFGAKILMPLTFKNQDGI